MEIRQTACSRDCPDVCSLTVEVDDRGRAVKLRGTADDPVTRGFLCERTSRFLERHYSPDRFLHPMWRPSKQAPLQPVSWDFALDWAAERLREVRAKWGPAAVLHYRSGGAMGLLKQLSEVLFENFGPVTLKRGDICSGAGEAAQEEDFGISESHDLFDLENSRTIVIWGKNVHTSSPHLLPLLLDARKRGTRLIGIDPIQTRLAGLVDEFVQPHPGTDFALAMAVAQRLLETPPEPHPSTYCENWNEFACMVHSRSLPEWSALCGVGEAQIHALAEAFQARPAALLIGWGLARRRNGAATVRALDALAALSGNLGIPGGGASYYFGRRTAFDSLPLGGLTAAPRTLSEARLGRELLQAQDPPVRLAWVTAGNPAAMLPDSETVRTALAALDCLIVVDTHPTDTTDLADLVLPTLTLLEDDDLLGAYGNHFLRASKPALEPAGEARHELWIWQQLADRLGFGEKLAGTPRDWKLRLVGRLQAAGVALEQLEQGPVRNPFASRVLFEGQRFPTPSGKMRLLHTEPPLPVSDPDYPYQLAAFSTPKAQCSQWAVNPDAIVSARLHPDSGLQQGERVRLETRRGAMEVRVELDSAVHPRQIVLPKGGMRRQAGCPNALIDAEETDLGGGAAYYDQPVRFVRLPLPSPQRELEPQSTLSSSS